MTDVVSQLTIKTEAQGAEQAASSLNKVAAATDKAATAAERLAGAQRPSVTAMVEAAKSSLNLERASTAQAARLDIAERAQQRFNKEFSAAERFRAAGLITETEYGKRIGLAAAAQKAMTAGLEVETAALGLNRMQMFETLHIVRSLSDEMVAGANPIRALALESGRLGEVMAYSGGPRQAFLALKETLSSAIGPMTATKAALFGIGGAAVAGVAGLVLLHHEVNVALEHMQKLVDIGTGAAKAGVGTSFFQAFTMQAKELNLETSDLVAMLQYAREANTTNIGENGGEPKNISRDRIRKNILAGYLDKSALTRFDAAGTEEERFRVQINLLDELIKKGDRLAAFDLSKTFFSPAFETQLRNGVDIIGKMRAALDGLTVAGGEQIIPNESIDRAEKIKQKLESIHNQLAKALKPAWDEIEKGESSFLDTMLNVNKAVVFLVEKFTTLLSYINSINDSWNHMLDRADRALGYGPSPYGDLSGVRAALGEGEAPALTVHGDRSHSLPSLTPKAAKATKADEVESYIKSLQKLAAAEQAEADTLGLGNKAKQEAVDLARALEAARTRGTPLTAKETAEVKQLADAYIAAKDKIEEYAKAQETAKATAEFFGQTLESTVEKLATGGESLKSALKDIVKLLEQAAIKAIILGEGPLASLFGTAGSGGAGAGGLGGIFGQLLKGFGFAEGGDLASGQFGIVGEPGPELIQGPAAITPFRQINAALNAGGGGRGGHAVAMTIDVRGAQGNAEIQTMIASGVRAGMEAVHSKIARDIGPISTRWERRFG
ncbi:MAG: hypothetical protein ACREC0_03940 [Methylocella sp.]